MPFLIIQIAQWDDDVRNRIIFRFFLKSGEMTLTKYIGLESKKCIVIKHEPLVAPGRSFLQNQIVAENLGVESTGPPSDEEVIA